MHLCYVSTETCWNGVSGSASTLTAPHQPQHNTSSRRLVCLISDSNKINSILYIILSIEYISLFSKFYAADWMTFPHGNQGMTFSWIECSLGNACSWMWIWICVFGWSLCVVIFSEWCFFLVLFIRLLTASQPCCLVLKVDCEWQRSLVASSTSPKRRCLTTLLTNIPVKALTG